ERTEQPTVRVRRHGGLRGTRRCQARGPFGGRGGNRKRILRGGPTRSGTRTARILSLEALDEDEEAGLRDVRRGRVMPARDRRIRKRLHPAEVPLPGPLERCKFCAGRVSATAHIR